MAAVRARSRPPPRWPAFLVTLLLLLALAAPSQQLEDEASASKSYSSGDGGGDGGWDGGGEGGGGDGGGGGGDASSSTSETAAPPSAAEREVAALLADSRGPGALNLGRQRVEQLSGLAQAAAGVGSSVAHDVSHRAAARLKAAKLLKGSVVDDAVTKAAAAIREQQRRAAASARTARVRGHLQDSLAEIVWVAAITACVAGALFSRRVMGWGDRSDGRSSSFSSRVPTTPEEVAEEARLKEEIRRQIELSKRTMQADQNPTNADVAEMRRRGTGHRLGLVEQLVHLRGGVSSPEELERARMRERETDLQRKNERWRLACEVAAAGCGATLGSLMNLGVSAMGMSYWNSSSLGGDDDARLAGRQSFGTVFGALVGVLAWLLVEPWAVSRFGLGPLVKAERMERERERNEGPAAMRPRRHRAGGALQGEDTDTNIDVMFTSSSSSAGGSGSSGVGAAKGQQREGMPDWLKRKLLGKEEPEPAPLPQVPGSVSAVRDRWAQQLRDIEEMAAAGNPVPAPARAAWDPVGIADAEWDDAVHREAAASADAHVRAEAGLSSTSVSGDARAGQRQPSNLYNFLTKTENKNSDSWFKTWK
jgi:hypothetical protein